MRSLCIFLVMIVGLLKPALALEPVNQTQQDPQSLAKLAHDFLQQHAKTMSGEAEITVSPPNPQLRLASCITAQAFLPVGSKLWGRMNIGIRCQQGASWQVYLQAELKIKTSHVVSKQALPAGHQVQAEDLQLVTTELPQFSSGLLLKSEQILGKTLSMPIAAGAMFRQETLKAPTIISQGQSVKIVSKGDGFQISTEGLALNQASAGQLVRAKVASGQVVQGFAVEQGYIELR